MTTELDPQVAALAERLVAVRRGILRPPPKLTLPEWADENRFLSPEAAAEPGRWKTSRIAVARGPMEAVTDPECNTVTVKCCTQLMKTELILNTIGYYIHQDPAPIIVMQPTVDLAEAFSKDRVAPMIRDTPVLKGKVADDKSRDSGNTILHKTFSGGHLTMIGANSPGQLAMRPVRVVLNDEVDKYPVSAGEEGDPLKILGERAATFWNYKFINTCSPTTEPHEHGGSRIEIEYRNGDMRIFEVDCPHCSFRHEMKWENVKWPKGKPKAAHYECPECSEPWTEPDRLRAIQEAAKRPPSVDAEGCRSGYGWRARKPFEGHASFQVSKLGSPWETLGKLAKKFMESHGKPALMKTFVNTQLAECWKERGDAPEWKKVYDRREDYKRNLIPMRGLILTAFADIQKDRIEVEIKAFGRNVESWSVDYRVFPGDTSSLASACWGDLAGLLREQFTHESGVCMKLDRLGIDAGYQTQVVYNFARKLTRDAANTSRLMVTLGRESSPVLIGIPQAKEARVDGKRAKRGIKVWHIGTNLAKEEFYGFLRQEPPPLGDPAPYGWCHFPQYEEEYFKQLTAEEVVTKTIRGYARREWTKTRERNEALDTSIGARAVASAFGLDRWTEDHWQEREGFLGVETPTLEPQAEPEKPVEAAPPPQKVAEVAAKAPVKRKKSSFW